MKKRIWKLIILFVLCLSMFSLTALAEENGQKSISDRANIFVNGIQITDENSANVLKDGKVSYDIENDILTLNGASISNNSDYGIRTEGDLTIVLEGVNTVASSSGSGINVKGNLIIEGKGSLKVGGFTHGIYSGNTLTIGENANVTVNVDSGVQDCYGIYSYSNMSIGEKATVTVETKSAPRNCYGIYSYDNMTIGGNANVTAVGGYGPERSCGLYAISTLEIEGNAVVHTTGSDNNTSDDAFNDSYGIRTTDLVINGGTLTATAGKSNAASDGIFSQTLSINGGTVTATGNTAYKGPSNGIEATKSLEISGGTVAAVGGETGNDTSCGIRAAGTMTVTGGKINADSKNATDTYGIQTTDFSMSNGSVIAKAANGTNSSRGIQALNSLTVSGGYVEASSGDAAEYSYGLQSYDVEVSGGYVETTSGKANVSSGASIFGSVNIDCTNDSSAYKVTIINSDSTSTNSVTVPAGQSVNDTYCELWGVDDFSELLNTNREGYIFSGWYTDEECTDGNEFSFDNLITSDITVYAKWEEEPALKVYNAFVLVQDALVSKDLEKLEIAVEEFYNVVDIFNELDEDGLADLAMLMNVEDGEAAYNMVLSDWVDANTILNVANAYNAFLNNPNEETAASYIEMIDGYDEIYGGDRTLLEGFIVDIDAVYEKAETVIAEAAESESKEDTKDEKDKTKDEKGKTTTTGKIVETVKTGDSSNLWIWITIVVLSCLVLVAVLIKRLKK